MSIEDLSKESSSWLELFHKEFWIDINWLKWKKIELKDISLELDSPLLIVPTPWVNISDINSTENNETSYVLEDWEIEAVLKKCKKLPNIPLEIAIWMHLFNSFTSRTAIILVPTWNSRVDVYIIEKLKYETQEVTQWTASNIKDILIPISVDLWKWPSEDSPKY